jgi:hypothetical protein
MLHGADQGNFILLALMEFQDIRVIRFNQDIAITEEKCFLYLVL